MQQANLKEDRIHGDPLYPIRVYEICCQPGEELLELHWHDELEFLMLTKGKAVFRVSMDDYELEAGEAIFVNSGQLHSGRISANEECFFTAVVFHSDILGGERFDLVREKYINPLIQQKFVTPAHITHHTAEERELLALLLQVFDLNINERPLYELSTKGLLQVIISKLIMLGGPAFRELPPSVNPTHIDRLKLIIEYMQMNYSSPIRLEDLAAIVSFSESYFCRYFKGFTGKSPLEYLNQVRAQRAAFLLKDTNKKITEISFDVGFNTLSYFIGVFKTHFGHTPSEYRKRLRTNEGTGGYSRIIVSS
ncbi:AraC family transcriptional regulator [Paenibacillus alginolyticus]|uniref:AraC family transcriptional regulator n=1 Tax=Paenibacillus alginolyticus TaxID=59839 RepID=A0ABT4G622_9BACL|nr:AraC family transcriptional regulator [Paenibacillus alginolyticus]MCY9668601.1 AraC family transcriptional regulator [Paenibacillus alginolyticus]MCY9691615.1 AraC family transcriptional regulator [Paenibacillus alginolyticus]MEC0146949.1 AraC family transcriptional regulator [Paenibacillus alginolyticus]